VCSRRTWKIQAPFFLDLHSIEVPVHGQLGEFV
jgi:hypothetical protein